MAIKVTYTTLDFDSNRGPVNVSIGKNEFVLGRLEENDLSIQSPEVSQIHAKIRMRKDTVDGQLRLYVTDLGSTNGTIVENVRLTPHREQKFALDKRIKIGNQILRVAAEL